MSDNRTPAEIQDDNIAHFMENGPGISTAYGCYVVARDPKQGRILLGGLGRMGVGRMWFTEEEHHHDYPGYAEAEQVFDDELWYSVGVTQSVGRTCPECHAIVADTAAHYDWHRSG